MKTQETKTLMLYNMHLIRGHITEQLKHVEESILEKLKPILENSTTLERSRTAGTDREANSQLNLPTIKLLEHDQKLQKTRPSEVDAGAFASLTQLSILEQQLLKDFQSLKQQIKDDLAPS